MSSFVFLGSKVPDIEALIAGLEPGLQVVILDPGQDGGAQIITALAGATNLDSIYIVPHRSEGTLYIGSTVLTEEILYQRELGQIEATLSEGGDILLYGCNVAAGAMGESVFASLATYGSSDVAAANDVIGSVCFGGNKVVASSIGTIDTSVAVNVSALEIDANAPSAIVFGPQTPPAIVPNYWTFSERSRRHRGERCLRSHHLQH